MIKMTCYGLYILQKGRSSLLFLVIINSVECGYEVEDSWSNLINVSTMRHVGQIPAIHSIKLQKLSFPFNLICTE